MPTRSIVILTGAGISAESGLPTFRGADGLWKGHRAEEVATPEAFARDPALVHEFYNTRRRLLLDPGIAPNAAHLAIARLQSEFPGEVQLFTQNVDDLHERAGSPDVRHMHGELLKSRCAACGAVAECRGDLGEESRCAACQAPGVMRPHIVWFGEVPFFLEEAVAMLRSADLFIAVGTSGRVYPAAGFVRVAKASGARAIEVNLEESATAALFDECRIGTASDQVPVLVEALLAEAAAAAFGD
ncbi:MAG: NAD-dependent deacylase [Verrucomicrobiales bacterium]